MATIWKSERNKGDENRNETDGNDKKLIGQQTIDTSTIENNRRNFYIYFERDEK